MTLHYLACRYRMCDGAKEITKAGEEVFGATGTRLMCWPHTYRNLVTRMSALRRENKTLCQELMSDIQDLQWSCHSEKTFVVVFHLLEKKYIVERKNSVKENSGVLDLLSFVGMRGHIHGLCPTINF